MSKRTGTVYLKASIGLAEGKAPSQFTLLKAGDNATDRPWPKNVITFDELAAATVMANWQADGSPRLYADWNHGMLDPDADRERAMSCANFVPAVVNGELIVTDIRWTELGKSDVESQGYNLFSPALCWDYGEDGKTRPRKLINFALVNSAGLKNIEPLLAARAARFEEETRTMDEIAKLNEKLAAANARIKELEQPAGEVLALSAAVGLAGDAPARERLATVQGLIALRSEVFKATGESTPESAVANLRALKINADKAVKLEAEIKEGKTLALRSELDGIWDTALKAGKLPPADRAEVESSLLALSGGSVTEGVVAAAKTYVAKLTPVVKMEAGGGSKAPAGAVALSATRLEIGRQFGRTTEQIQAFEASRNQQG